MYVNLQCKKNIHSNVLEMKFLTTFSKINFSLPASVFASKEERS